MREFYLSLGSSLSPPLPSYASCKLNHDSQLFCSLPSRGATMEHAPALEKELPPGFRFHPTDEEIITHYLTPKVIDHGFTARAVGEVDLNKCEPWDLPRMAKMGGKEMYFFCQKDRKYPTGMRTNRATESGYWKATGKDKEIYRGKGVLVGMKKTLVFYKGRAPKGGKTNWVMHEFRIEGKHSLPNVPKSAKEEWVVCRVFHKNSMELKKSPPAVLERIHSFGDDPFRSTNMAPVLSDPPYMNNDVHISDTGAPTFIVGSESDRNQQMLITNSNPPNDPNDSAYYSLLSGSANPGYLHLFDESMLLSLTAANNGATAASAVRMHCKVEPYCSSDPSHDAGLNMSTVSDADIGSALPKYYGSLDEPWAGFRF